MNPSDLSDSPPPKFLPGMTNNHGFGIMEVLVSLLLIALGIVGFGMAIPLGKDSIEELREERTALFLAKQMMEEIQSKAYEDPDLPSGSFGQEESAPRDNFDDMDDYDNWDQSPPQYQDGTAMPAGYNNFRRSVVVENVDDNDYSDNSMAAGTTDSKRIIVTIFSEKTPPSFPDVVIKWVANKEGMDLLY